MFEFNWVDREYSTVVARHRLDNLEAIFARGDLVPVAARHRRRETSRLGIEEPHGRQTFYVKREQRLRWRDRLRGLTHLRIDGTKARHEFEILRRLAGSGIRCPRPIVCLEQGWARPRGCLVLEELSDFEPLNQYLAQSPPEPGRREALFLALAHEVARLHATGVDQPDLYADHVYVAPRGADRWEVAFLDFQRSGQFAALPLACRIRDLAALVATCPPRLVGPDDWHVFFDAYLLECGLEAEAARIVAGVERAVERLLTNRRIWEIRESDTQTHRAFRRLDPVEPGHLWIDRRDRPYLERAGLGSFAAIHATRRGTRLRALADRENRRIEWIGEDGQPQAAYLKRHRVRTWRTWLRARLGLGPGSSAGTIEARNVARLSRAGIAAMRLVAYGQKLRRDGWLESFVLTDELTGYTQLDHFLRRRFTPLGEHAGRGGDRDLARLLEQVADVTRKFHQLGYNHRDLYCCHFFIREDAPGDFRVNLIDLQRVEHRLRHRRRWLVKDLAQLAYSAPRDRISCTARMAFIHSYLGVRRLDASHKRFVRRILAKQRRMEQNLGKHP